MLKERYEWAAQSEADSPKIAQQTFESRVDHYTGMAEAQLPIISHLRKARALH